MATKRATKPRQDPEQIRLLRGEITRLEQQVALMRHRMRGTLAVDAPRLDDNFVGVDVGSFFIAWTRLDGETLDDFDTVILRDKKQPIEDARRALRLKIPDMLARWSDGGLPTVVGIEEPMYTTGFASIHTSKALAVFKTMIEEALFEHGHVVMSVTPAEWHGLVRSSATSKQMTRHRTVKRGRNVLDAKGLGAELANLATKGSPARAAVKGELTQDESDAFWISMRTRFDYWSRKGSGEA